MARVVVEREGERAEGKESEMVVCEEAVMVQAATAAVVNEAVAETATVVERGFQAEHCRRVR